MIDEDDAATWPDFLPANAPPPAIAPFDEAQANKHQQAWANYLGLPVEREIDLPGGEKLTMVLIPPGEFMMGSTEEEVAQLLEEAKEARDKSLVEFIPSEAPQHRVRISRPFYLGKYELTQGQWEAVIENNPSKFNGNPSHPVEYVSWDDVQPLLENSNEVCEKEGMEFVLPSEPQWEYECRTGTDTAWYCGNSKATLHEFAWFNANGERKTHSVGSLKANAWGLYDMHGNPLRPQSRDNLRQSLVPAQSEGQPAPNYRGALTSAANGAEPRARLPLGRAKAGNVRLSRNPCRVTLHHPVLLPGVPS